MKQSFTLVTLLCFFIATAQESRNFVIYKDCLHKFILTADNSNQKFTATLEARFLKPDYSWSFAKKDKSEVTAFVASADQRLAVVQKDKNVFLDAQNVATNETVNVADWDTSMFKVKWTGTGTDAVLIIAHKKNVDIAEADFIESVKTVTEKNKKDCTSLVAVKLDARTTREEFVTVLDMMVAECPESKNLEEDLKNQNLADKYKLIKDDLFEWALNQMRTRQLKTILDSVAALGNDPAAEIRMKENVAIVFINEEVKKQLKTDENAVTSLNEFVKSTTTSKSRMKPTTEANKEAKNFFESERKVIDLVAAEKHKDQIIESYIHVYKIKECEFQMTNNMMNLTFRLEDLLDPTNIIRLKTDKFLISTKSNLARISWSSLDEESDGFSTDIYLSDLIELKAHSAKKVYLLNFANENTVITPGQPLALYTKRAFDYLNAKAFFDAYSTFANEKTEEINNPAPLQMEIGFDAPMERLQWKRVQYLSDFSGSFNFSPMGKSSPFYLLKNNTSGDNNRPLNYFELLRNHYINDNVRISLFKMNGGKEFMFWNFGFGFRHYLTNVREQTYKIRYNSNPVIYDTVPDLENRTITSMIGPELSFKYQYAVNQWFGFDMTLSYNFLKIQRGADDDFKTLLEKYHYSAGKYGERSLHVFSYEANLFFQVFKLAGASNAGGFFMRYRLYDDMSSNTKAHHQFLVGYSTNLRNFVK